MNKMIIIIVIFICLVHQIQAIFENPFARPVTELPTISSKDIDIHLKQIADLEQKQNITDVDQTLLRQFNVQTDKLLQTNQKDIETLLTNFVEKNPTGINNSADAIKLQQLYNLMLDTPISAQNPKTFRIAIIEELKKDPIVSEYDALANVLAQESQNIALTAPHAFLAARGLLDRETTKQLLPQNTIFAIDWFGPLRQGFQEQQQQTALPLNAPVLQQTTWSKTTPTPTKERGAFAATPLGSSRIQSEIPTAPEQETQSKRPMEQQITQPIIQTTVESGLFTYPIPPKPAPKDLFSETFIIQNASSSYYKKPMNVVELRDAFQKGLELYFDQLLQVANDLAKTKSASNISDSDIIKTLLKNKQDLLKKNKQNPNNDPDIIKLKKLLKASETLDKIEKQQKQQQKRSSI